MLVHSGRGLQALGLPCLLPASRGLATANPKEGLGEKLKHAAEDAVHKAEDVIHRVTDAVHERREHAREEAERGMFTADDIREAADQILHSRDKKKKTKGQEARQYHPDDEEQLLQDASSDVGRSWRASSDVGRSWRQKELESLRSAVGENEEQATEAVKHAGEEYKKDHPR